MQEFQNIYALLDSEESIGNKKPIEKGCGCNKNKSSENVDNKKSEILSKLENKINENSNKLHQGTGLNKLKKALEELGKKLDN